jgi:hypothetical protein
MLPSGPHIHQMANAEQEEAISIHIYGFDHRRHATSVEREYRAEQTPGPELAFRGFSAVSGGPSRLSGLHVRTYPADELAKGGALIVISARDAMGQQDKQALQSAEESVRDNPASH